jgi:hypothetical protein
MNQTMFDQEQWSEVGALELGNKDLGTIDIGAIDIETLLPQAKERLLQIALVDDKYQEIYKKVKEGKHKDNNFSLEDDLLWWKKRVNAPEKLRTRIIQS